MRGTEVLPTVQETHPGQAREVRVGIIGYGTVGRATAEMLVQNAAEISRRTGGANVRLTHICRRSPQEGECGVSGLRISSNWKEVVEAEDVDVVIETIGGTTVAYDVVRSALANNKAVVTANKALLARCGGELFALADELRLPIGIEASVGGGVPVIQAISEALAADRILAVYGIANGTSNYILTQMEHHGVDFAVALAQAQAAGYAEADPSFDIDGLDARDKICILARLAFGGALLPDSVRVSGIRAVSAMDFHYARRLDSTIRLVAAAERVPAGISVSVRPWLVARDSMLAKVDGPNNALFLVGERVGTQMLYGHGAGGGATATAVLSDVIKIARGIARGQFAPNLLPGFSSSESLLLSDPPRPMPWYLRLTVVDRPGILSRVADVIAHEGINIDSVLQEPHMRKERLSFVITLEPVRASTVQCALEAINRFEFMLEPVLELPMVSAAG